MTSLLGILFPAANLDICHSFILRNDVDNPSPIIKQFNKCVRPNRNYKKTVIFDDINFYQFFRIVIVEAIRIFFF